MPNLGLQSLVLSWFFLVFPSIVFTYVEEKIFGLATHMFTFCFFWLISGEAGSVEDEVVVINSIVLPNKTLNISVQDEIIL